MTDIAGQRAQLSEPVTNDAGREQTAPDDRLVQHTQQQRIRQSLVCLHVCRHCRDVLRTGLLRTETVLNQQRYAILQAASVTPLNRGACHSTLQGCTIIMSCPVTVLCDSA